MRLLLISKKNEVNVLVKIAAIQKRGAFIDPAALLHAGEALAHHAAPIGHAIASGVSHAGNFLHDGLRHIDNFSSLHPIASKFGVIPAVAAGQAFIGGNLRRLPKVLSRPGNKLNNWFGELTVADAVISAKKASIGHGVAAHHPLSVALGGAPTTQAKAFALGNLSDEMAKIPYLKTFFHDAPGKKNLLDVAKFRQHLENIPQLRANLEARKKDVVAGVRRKVKQEHGVLVGSNAQKANSMTVHKNVTTPGADLAMEYTHAQLDRGEALHQRLSAYDGHGYKMLEGAARRADISLSRKWIPERVKNAIGRVIPDKVKEGISAAIPDKVKTFVKKYAPAGPSYAHAMYLPVSAHNTGAVTAPVRQLSRFVEGTALGQAAASAPFHPLVPARESFLGKALKKTFPNSPAIQPQIGPVRGRLLDRRDFQMHGHPGKDAHTSFYDALKERKTSEEFIADKLTQVKQLKSSTNDAVVPITRREVAVKLQHPNAPQHLLDATATPIPPTFMDKVIAKYKSVASSF